MPKPHQLEGVVEPSAQVYGCEQVQHLLLGKILYEIRFNTPTALIHFETLVLRCYYIGLEDIQTKTWNGHAKLIFFPEQ
jgi:hypothetical protein